MNYQRNSKLHNLIRIYFSLRTRKMKAIDIANRLNINVRSVQRYINDLICSGIIIERIQVKHQGLFYRIRPEDNKIDLL